MARIAQILIGLIAVMHVYFAWIEIVSWASSGRTFFPDKPDTFFAETKTLAANQGFYNLFLTAGLVWALMIKDAIWSSKVATCFLIFVLTAGIFGTFTISIKPLLAQTIPATLALAALYIRR
ncbi:MAG: DUF1304 domain-containing protein [Litoreibacter sp.]